MRKNREDFHWSVLHFLERRIRVDNMTSFIQLLTVLVIILLAAKSAGFLAHQLGQPSVLGELLVGLALGPSLLDITHLSWMTDPHLTETVIQLGDFGVLLLMFLAGIEVNLSELAGQMKVSALAGTLGVVLPVLLGWAAGLLLKMDSGSALFLGLTMGATSVSISVQTLIELKALRSRVGMGLLGAAVFDDILVILILSIALAVLDGSGSIGAILWIILKIFLFLCGSVGLGWWAFPRLLRWIHRLSISQGAVSLALIIMLIYGIAAELVGGMAAITGAFLAGLMFSRSPEKQILATGFQTIGYGFLIPIFFVSIGLNLNLRELHSDVLILFSVMTLLAIVGKWLGAGLGALLAGFSRKEAAQLGAGMISRGEVGLIVASVGLTQNLVSQAEFSAVIGMVVVTTLVTPLLLRALFPSQPNQPLDQKQQKGEKVLE